MGAGGSSDPTWSDTERICGTSLLHRLVQQHVASASSRAGAPRPTLCYVPCRIRWTLLAQLSPRTQPVWQGGRLGLGLGASPLRGPGGQHLPGAMSRAPAPETYSKIVGHRAQPLAVGSEASIARLLAATLWFSAEAASAVWACARDGEANCIYHEALMRRKAARLCAEEGSLCEAYQHIQLSAMLAQDYALVVSVYRAFGSVAFKLLPLIRGVGLCRALLQGDRIKSDISALGLTIARYVCLAFRYILMSPQVAHLRGGCAFLLKGLRTLEQLLQLSPIPLRSASGRLPNHLLAPAGVETSANSAATSALSSAASTTTPDSSTPIVHTFQLRGQEWHPAALTETGKARSGGVHGDGDGGFEAALRTGKFQTLPTLRCWRLSRPHRTRPCRSRRGP